MAQNRKRGKGKGVGHLGSQVTDGLNDERVTIRGGKSKTQSRKCNDRRGLSFQLKKNMPRIIKSSDSGGRKDKGIKKKTPFSCVPGKKNDCWEK